MKQDYPDFKGKKYDKGKATSTFGTQKKICDKKATCAVSLIRKTTDVVVKLVTENLNLNGHTAGGPLPPMTLVS